MGQISDQLVIPGMLKKSFHETLYLPFFEEIGYETATYGRKKYGRWAVYQIGVSATFSSFFRRYPSHDRGYKVILSPTEEISTNS